MAWDTTKVDGTDDVLAADWNAMVTYIKSSLANVTRSDKRGSDCSGADGTVSRILTLSNTAITKSMLSVSVNGTILHSADLTASHLAASSTITFINKIWDTDYISVVYNT